MTDACRLDVTMSYGILNKDWNDWILIMGQRSFVCLFKDT
jgi:hypothetical protein